MKNLFQETSSGGRPTPGSPSTKTRGKLYLFPAVNIPALNDFFLYPRAAPSKIPTGLSGPLPPQTFGLLLGQSSLTSKGMTIHPGITDSDYKGEIQIQTSSQILWQFKKGDKIAQLFLLLYISVNSSNNVRTGRFGNTDQKILMDITGIWISSVQFNSVQSLSRVWLFVTPWIAAHQASLSPTPGVHSNSHPSSQWCHPAISSSVVPFSSCPQSFPATESFPMIDSTKNENCRSISIMT